MKTATRDPKYIAETVRNLRKIHGLTQENLAHAASLSCRTIEKVESGKHCPNEQTLRSISRALDLDVAIFNKISQEEEAKAQKQFENMLKKTAVLSVHRIQTAKEFMGVFGDRHGFRFDNSAIEDDSALAIFAEMCDWISDLCDIWDECSMSHRLEYAKKFAELCNDLEEIGYSCYMGYHRQKERKGGSSSLVFVVGVVTIQARNDTENTRQMIIHLEDEWETHPEDRLTIDQFLMEMARS